MELIRTENISYTYSDTPVLTQISVSVQQGEIISLLGPNGSGKTTLIKLILGIYRPASGAVFFEGRSMQTITARELARRIAYVPQSHKMVFAYKVMDVVLMGRMPHKSFFFRYSDQDREAALHSLERLSILHLKDKLYTDVSGGERQLVLIARALAQGADTLVMDEPANSLDFGNQIRLLDEIQKLAQEGYTFVKSTHFPDHALWIADRVILLKNGTLIADGAPDDIMNDDSIGRLYNTRISILRMGDGAKTCFPRSMLKLREAHP